MESHCRWVSRSNLFQGSSCRSAFIIKFFEIFTIDSAVDSGVNWFCTWSANSPWKICTDVAGTIITPENVWPTKLREISYSLMMIALDVELWSFLASKYLLKYPTATRNSILWKKSKSDPNICHGCGGTSETYFCTVEVTFCWNWQMLHFLTASLMSSQNTNSLTFFLCVLIWCIPASRFLE